MMNALQKTGQSAVASSALLHRKEGVSRTCWSCGCIKPVVDFYDNPRTLCKACVAERTKEWAKNNPEKRKEVSERYRKTPRGKAAWYRRHKKWREANQWCDRERFSRICAALTDGYIKSLLKMRGIKNPTPEQTADKRRFIQALRAKRTISLLSYGARIQN